MIFMAPFVYPHLKNHPLATGSLVYQTNTTFIISRITNQRLFIIDPNSFLYAPYKLLPSVKNIFMCTLFFLFLSFSLHTFLWACGSLRESWKSFFFVHSAKLVSHVCSTCHTIFSLKSILMYHSVVNILKSCVLEFFKIKLQSSNCLYTSTK